MPAAAGDSGPWLVLGLGNPGPGYAAHRHNAGAMVVAELARRTGSTLRPGPTRGGRALVAQVRLGAPPGTRAVLAQPLTFMNESGGPAAALAAFYKVPADHLVVVHDELDIPFGEVRVKRGGGEGGHNGLRSSSASLGTRDYLRVRVGIGRPPGRMDPADFVLRGFSTAERPEVPLMVDSAADAVEMLIAEGLATVQQRFHTQRSGN